MCIQQAQPPQSPACPFLLALSQVFVGLPNKPARRDILQVVLVGEALAPGVDLGR